MYMDFALKYTGSTTQENLGRDGVQHFIGASWYDSFLRSKRAIYSYNSFEVPDSDIAKIEMPPLPLHIAGSATEDGGR